LRYVMSDAAHLAEQQRQRERVHSVAEKLCAAGAAALDPFFATEFDGVADDSARLRVVVDQIASVTEGRLERWQQLSPPRRQPGRAQPGRT